MSGPLDVWFPKLGPCLICGVPGVDQRHRVVDAIAESVRAGADEGQVADDYGVPVEAVRVAVEHTGAGAPHKESGRSGTGSPTPSANPAGTSLYGPARTRGRVSEARPSVTVEYRGYPGSAARTSGTPVVEREMR